MKHGAISIVFLIFLMGRIDAQEIKTGMFFPAVTSFSLTDVNKEAPAFINVSEKALQLFVFISPECPLCQNYSSVIQSIQDKYQQQLQVYAIVPGNAYDSKTIALFKQKYQNSFAFFTDSSMQLTKYLQATVTPQVVLLNQHMQLIYSGAIDNWAIAVGKKRSKATEFYLLNAIESTLHKQPVLISHTRPVGCKINDY